MNVEVLSKDFWGTFGKSWCIFFCIHYIIKITETIIFGMLFCIVLGLCGAMAYTWIIYKLTQSTFNWLSHPGAQVSMVFWSQFTFLALWVYLYSWLCSLHCMKHHTIILERYYQYRVGSEWTVWTIYHFAFFIPYLFTTPQTQ